MITYGNLDSPGSLEAIGMRAAGAVIASPTEAKNGVVDTGAE